MMIDVCVLILIKGVIIHISVILVTHRLSFSYLHIFIDIVLVGVKCHVAWRTTCTTHNTVNTPQSLLACGARVDIVLLVQ